MRSRLEHAKVKHVKESHTNMEHSLAVNDAIVTANAGYNSSKDGPIGVFPATAVMISTTLARNIPANKVLHSPLHGNIGLGASADFYETQGTSVGLEIRY